MLLSVIVPVYNAENYLPECLKSLNIAWRDGIEIILVDDGSKDSSGYICDCFQKQYKFVKVIHQTNSGSVAARKKGVKEATGLYITSVDADDWIESDYLEHMLHSIKVYEPDAIVMNLTSVCNQEKTVLKNLIAAGFYQGTAIDAIRSQMLCYDEKPYQFGIYPSLCTKCFKKELLERMFDQAPTDVSLGDDAIITYPYLYNAKSIYVSDHAGYNYRTNENSMTRAYNAKLASQCVHLLKYFSDLAKEYGDNFLRQIQAYGRYITKFVFINEFVRSKQGYKASKASFLHFLNQGEVLTALKMKEPFDISLKDRVFYRCLSWKIIILPYVIIRMIYK